jgi:hypothetical protein
MMLRDVASLCTSGPDGRRAILLLSALRLDPRNPDVRPDSAALHAMRYLALPDAEPADRPLATALYLMAVDQGANASLRPVASDAPGSISDRFSSCDLPAEPVAFVPPPLLMREPRAVEEARIRAQRDSLSRRTIQLEENAEAMRQRLLEMETELQRIRRLLGVPPGRPPGLEPR